MTTISTTTKKNIHKQKQVTTAILKVYAGKKNRQKIPLAQRRFNHKYQK